MSARALLIAGVLALTAAQAQSPKTLSIDSGRLAVPTPSADGVVAFKGIPYAAPPVGQRRWREPAPVPPWKGVRQTDRFAPNCLQPKLYRDIDPFDPSMSEDCLYLNIWTAAKPGEARPVFFWIHGGGYRAGYGSELRHDGAALAKKGVVVVTINYRLGVFGFLAHPELTAESPHHASGDYAYADMIAALLWVKRNIAKFGGDPNRITIAGESAGSDAVSRLMASPQAAGLFQRAIGESGAAFGTMHTDTLADAEAKGLTFAKAMNGATIAGLRARSSAEILALVLDPNVDWSFGPDVDGWVLPDTPRNIFAAGKQNDVPLLAGWNADEGILFDGVPPHKETLAALLEKRFGDKAQAAEQFYPLTSDPQSRALLAGDTVIAQPTWNWAVAQKRTGHAPVFLYRFDQVPPIPPDWFGPDWQGKYVGAFHSGEIPYIFDHPEVMPGWQATDADRKVADVMSSAWVAFATTGNPNGFGVPQWTPYDPNGSAERMVFGPQTGEVPDTDLPRRRFLESNLKP